MKYEVFHKQLNLFKMWDGLAKAPSQSLVIDSFYNLKKAIAWMEAFELLSYSPKITYEAKLPALITEMAVITDKEEILASKFYLFDNLSGGLVEGIYLEINKDYLTVNEFIKVSKLDISSMKNPNGDGKTFLVATIDDLENMKKNELKIHAASRNIRSLPGQGMNLN